MLAVLSNKAARSVPLTQQDAARLKQVTAQAKRYAAWHRNAHMAARLGLLHPAQLSGLCTCPNNQ